MLAPFLLKPEPFPGQPKMDELDFMLLKNLIANGLLTMFFYFSYYFLIPKFFSRKYFTFFLFFLISAFITIIPPIIVEKNGGPPPHRHGTNNELIPLSKEEIRKDSFTPANAEFKGPEGRMKHGPGHWEDDLFLFVSVFIIAIALKLQSRYKQTEKEKLAAELAYLKSQINPHFLFNTLNSIYSLALKKSDETANAIVKLSGMMRYNLTDAQLDFIEISKEIDYISSYIALQKIRIGETATVKFEITGNQNNLQIAPLLLIPFIENAFKYGVNPEIDSAISIRIEMQQDSIALTVKNNIVPVYLADNSKTGTGIVNVKRRLELIYPGTYELNFNQSENDYQVNLNIKIK
jgi:hypothetical protein